MKTKNYFCSIAMMALVAATPVTLTSCDEDDVKTVLDIIDTLFASTDDLAGTAWLATDNSMAIEFSSGNQGNLYDSSMMDDNGAIAQPFTYSLDTTNNILTITLNSGGTRKYTVTKFTKGVELTLTYNGVTIKLKPYSE